MAGYQPIEVQRNADFVCAMTFTDREGDPLDLTGAVFYMRFKTAEGAPTAVAAAVITPVDPVLGMIEVVVHGYSFNGVPGPMETVLLAYDIIAEQNGFRIPLMRGPLVLTPGVS